MGINAFPGDVKSAYQATAPTNPRVGDIWVDSASDIASVDLIPSKITGHNLLHNGAMQIHQRGTSSSGITSSSFYTADRWWVVIGTLGTWTNSIENDAPTGSGFRKSLKMLCTTADASPAAGDYAFVRQRIEGQNLQSVKKGTSSAEQLTISFWVKSNKTGVYVLEMYDEDNSRIVASTYTINASDTWEKKTITFPADTTGTWNNDNDSSLQVNFWFASGSDYTSGTLRTNWASYTAADRAVGVTNLASATNQYWQITGVQLETGPSATNYEFKDYGQELSECQRYYYRAADGYGNLVGTAVYYTTTSIALQMPLPVTMRAVPVAANVQGVGYFKTDPNADAFDSLTLAVSTSNKVANFYNITEIAAVSTAGLACYVYTNNAASVVALSADL